MSTSRCVCGLRVAIHFDGRNRKLTCVEAAKRHPYATYRAEGFREALARSALALVRRESAPESPKRDRMLETWRKS